MAERATRPVAAPGDLTRSPSHNPTGTFVLRVATPASMGSTTSELKRSFERNALQLASSVSPSVVRAGGRLACTWRLSERCRRQDAVRELVEVKRWSPA